VLGLGSHWGVKFGMTAVVLGAKELMGGKQDCQTAGALSSGSGGMCIDWSVIRAGVFRFIICSNVHVRGLLSVESSSLSSASATLLASLASLASSALAAVPV